MNAHAPAAAPNNQVRLPIDSFSLTSPGACSSRDFIAQLQPRILEGLKLLPQWPAIERLGGQEKWSRNMCYRMLDEARALNPSENQMAITATQADAATQRLTWHLRRMSGIGGSEIGVFVGEKRGLNDAFTTAREIVAKKLCLGLPDRETVHTLRGKRAEDEMRAKFMAANPDMKRDDVALRRAAAGRPASMPWLIGSPDEIVLQKDEEGRLRRIIVDYKAPGETVMKETYAHGPSFGYVCQLHHYAIVANSAGVPASRAILAPWDGQKWQMVSFNVGFERSLVGDILDTARSVWNDNIMAGVLPPEKTAVAIDKAGLRDPASDLAVLDAMSKVIDERKKAILKDLASELQSRRASGEADFGPWKIKAGTAYDAEMLRQMAHAFDVDPAKFETPNPKKISKEACVAIVMDILDAFKVREITEQETPGKGDEAFLAVMADIKNKLADGPPKDTVFDAAGLAAAVMAAGGDPRPTESVAPSFLASTKKEHYKLLREFRENVDAVVGEGAKFCQEAVFQHWPELANSSTTERLTADLPDFEMDAA